MNKDRRFSIFPYILITVGVIFALENFGILDDAFSKLWPVILIVMGLVMIAKDFSGKS